MRSNLQINYAKLGPGFSQKKFYKIETMKAEPTMPKMCLVLWATRVSTKASLEVMRVGWVRQAGWSGLFVLDTF